jgi:beta-N-acetylhexosaminidase
MKIRSIVLALLGLLFTVAPLRAQATLLESMTLEQKVAQMFMVAIYGEYLNELGRNFLTQWQPGAISMMGNNMGVPAQVTQLTNDYQQTVVGAGGIPMFVATDQEGGVVARLTAEDGFTQWPSPVVITATNNPELAARYGQAIGEELAAVGINMNLAPVADLENPDNPVVQFRSFGSDGNVNAPIVAGVVSGMQSAMVMATAKHFPGHSDTNEDSHAILARVDVTPERLEQMLAPFRGAISADVGAIMVAHIWFPSLEPEERPASLSSNVVTGLLRNQLGYNGIIMTDALDMNAVDLNFTPVVSIIEAVNAGIDMFTLGPNFGWDAQHEVLQGLVDAVRSGQISEERINQSVQRILDAKQRFGVLDWQPLDIGSAATRVNAEAHAELLNEVFRNAVTVAVDRSDHIPLKQDRRVAILFPGTRYQIYNECSQYPHPNLQWLAISDAPGPDEITSAITMAGQVDTIVVFTQNARQTIEQQELVNALPQDKVVSISIWSVYDWLTYPNVSTYMATYSPLRPNVPAACAVLFGAIPANGQLSVTLSPELPAGTHAQ